MATKQTKAKMAKLLSERGFPLPEKNTVEALEHRLYNWEEGNGYLVRRMKMRNLKLRTPLPVPMETGKVYWIPNSDFARQIIKTRVVALLTRAPYIPKGATLLDIPYIGSSDIALGEE
jgi:hypothetical protein